MSNQLSYLKSEFLELGIELTSGGGFMEIWRGKKYIASFEFCLLTALSFLNEEKTKRRIQKESKQNFIEREAARIK